MEQERRLAALCSDWKHAGAACLPRSRRREHLGASTHQQPLPRPGIPTNSTGLAIGVSRPMSGASLSRNVNQTLTEAIGSVSLGVERAAFRCASSTPVGNGLMPRVRGPRGTNLRICIPTQVPAAT